MPEFPDIEVYLEALRARIGGQPLEEARLSSPFLLRTVEPTLESFFGILAGKTKKVVTIDEMNEAAAAGWVGAKNEADR